MKELIAWNEMYNLGIKEIDSQHQKMIGIINKLYQAMQQISTEKESLGTILKEIEDYADYHFATEEKYFQEFNYEDKAEHTKLHNAYKETVTRFIDKYKNNETQVLSFDLMDFLGAWWTGHILGEDRGYAKCFHENGLK